MRNPLLSLFFRAVLIAPFLIPALIHAQAPELPEQLLAQSNSVPAPPRQVNLLTITPITIGADFEVGASQVQASDTVVIFGNLKVYGEVRGDVAAFGGNVMIDGYVEDDVTVILGDLTLGPKANIQGQVAVIGGRLEVKEGAQVRRPPILHVPYGQNIRFEHPLSAWWRPPGHRFIWIWVAISTAICALLALAFPAGIRRCGETLVKRPVASLFTAVLGMFAVPVLFALLVITVVGIPVALVMLPLGVLMCDLFGKASILALIGWGVSRGRLSPVFAVLVGSALLSLFFLMPLVGMAISGIMGIFGFGAALATATKANRAAKVQPAALEGSGPALPLVGPDPRLSGLASDPQGDADAMPAESRRQTIAPELASDFRPRAGFWQRMMALILDAFVIALLVGIPLAAMEEELFVLTVPALVVYAILMWAWRGTTIGGIICNLRVERLDGRSVGLTTAFVRGLGCFLSAAAALLGFLWIAVDADKQAWHDKIAGTVVVKARRGSSLV